MTRHYIGTATIASWFGVAPRTVTTWHIRFLDFPRADVAIPTKGTYVYGWDRSRELEIRRWYAGRPGQGRRTDLRRVA